MILSVALIVLLQQQCEEEVYAEIVNNIQIALNEDFYYEDKIVYSRRNDPFACILVPEERHNELITRDNSDYFSTLLLGVLYQNNIFDFHTQITFLSDNLFYPQN